MKFSIKGAFSFFLGLIVISLVVELVESSIGERAYDYELNKVMRYAIIAVMYGFWKGWRENKKLKEVKE